VGNLFDVKLRAIGIFIARASSPSSSRSSDHRDDQVGRI
jgi:hypothetical protein